MNRQEFRKELHSSLENTVLKSIEEYLNHQRKIREQTIRYISALDSKYGKPEKTIEGLSSVLEIIKKEIHHSGQESLLTIYMQQLDRSLEQFPETAVWQQAEERFVAQPDDSAVVAAGKKLKYIFRSIHRGWHKVKFRTVKIFGGNKKEYQEWKQAVLVRNVVEYHLLDEEMVSGWINRIKRQQLQLVTAIENLLVTIIDNNELAEPVADFKKLAQSLDNKSLTHQESLKNKIKEDLHKKESELMQVAEKVGTIECRSARYRESKIASKRERIVTELQKNEEKWTEALTQLQVRSHLMTEFLELRTEITQQLSDFLDGLAEYYQKLLQEPMRELGEMVDGGIQHSEISEFSSLKNKLKQYFDSELIAPVKKSVEQDVFSKKIEHLTENVLMHANTVSEKSRLLSKVELEENPPRINSREVEWRLLVVRSIREKILNVLEPHREKFAQFAARILNDLKETAEVVEVNLESAVSLEEKGSVAEGENPASIAREALERALANIEDLEKQLSEEWQVLEEEVNEGQKAFIEQMFSLIYEGDLNQLQLLNAKYKARETTKDWKTWIQSRLARVQDKSAAWIRLGTKKIKEWYAPIGEFLGLKEKKREEVKRADIATYLTETDQKIKELPYIYRQLFNFSGTADPRFYVPATDAVSMLKKAVEQWRNSFPVTMALIGEKGSGKSSFLDHVLKSEVEERQLLKISLDDTISSERELVELFSDKLELSGVDTVEGIISAVHEQMDQKVIALENIQNCYVRCINGFEAIEKLCYLISETRDRIFWITSCSRYAWQFLDKSVQLSEYFSYVSVCDDLDPDEIEKVILNRHRASGYTLHFEADNETAKSRSYKKLMEEQEEEQEFLQEVFFKKLTELAEGNASVAMIFWIRSIKEFDDTHCFIRPLEVTSLDIVNNLSPNILFALAAFVLHDTLSDDDFSRILNLDIKESRLILNRLQARGLLEYREGSYSINHLMYRQIVRVLKARNIIHLV